MTNNIEKIISNDFKNSISEEDEAWRVSLGPFKGNKSMTPRRS